MVLHNSKWDKRATRRYQKKHGLSKEDLQKERELRKNNKKKLAGETRGPGSEKEDDETESEPSSGDEEDDENENENENGSESENHEGLEGENDDKEDEHGQIEVKLWPDPEPDDEGDVEQYLALARKTAQKRYTETHYEEGNKNIKVLSNASDLAEFERIKHEVERAQLKNDITRRFGRKKPTNLEPVSPNTGNSGRQQGFNIGGNGDGDDFDAFLEEMDRKLELDKKSPCLSAQAAGSTRQDKPLVSSTTTANNTPDWSTADNFL